MSKPKPAITETAVPPAEGETYTAWCARVGAKAKLDVPEGAVWLEGRWARLTGAGSAAGPAVKVRLGEILAKRGRISPL